MKSYTLEKTAMDFGQMITLLNKCIMNSHDFIKEVYLQCIKVQKTILIFERMFPNAVAKFVFDQSSAHGAFAKDALNARDMNVKPCGKQRTMHDTYIPMDNPYPELHGQHQTMNFTDDLAPDHPYFEFCGQPKGMQCVLEEHGLISVLKVVWEVNSHYSHIPPFSECLHSPSKSCLTTLNHI